MTSSYTSNHLRLLSLTKQLTSLVNNSRHHQALTLFHHLHSTPSLSLDSFVYPLALKSCAALRLSLLGTSIHSLIAKSSHASNPFVSCALVDYYGKCGSVPDARKVFDEMSDRNVVVWNAMISVYVRNGEVGMAIVLFERMDVERNASSFNAIIGCLSESGEEDGYGKAIGFYRRMMGFGVRPNLVTVLALLPVCVGLAGLDLIKEIHGYSIRNGIDPDPQLRSCLVESYGRCGCLDHVLRVFESMDERDVVAWSSLISAFALNGDAPKALDMFHKMELARVRPDAITFLSVMKACSHAGLPDKAKEYFSRMRSYYHVEPTSDHYSCLVDVLSRSGRLYEAYNVLNEMPTKATAKAWGALLGACRTYGEVELAEIAGRALFEIEPDNAANYVLLARIYASQGRHEEADRVRRRMEGRSVKIAPGSSWLMHQE